MAKRRGDPRKKFPIPAEELEGLLQDMEYLERWFRQHREHALARAEVRPDEHQLLAAVGEGQGATVGRVAKILEQSDSQAGRRLAQLGKKGWINLGKKAKDQRKRTVEVTEKGKAMFASCKHRSCHVKYRTFPKNPFHVLLQLPDSTWPFKSVSTCPKTGVLDLTDGRKVVQIPIGP